MAGHLQLRKASSIWQDQTGTIRQRDELKRSLWFRLSPMHMVPFEWIPGVLPVRYSARVMTDLLKTVIDELLIDKHTGSAAVIRAIDVTSSLGSSVSRACSRLSKWIEPGIHLARNIRSSKQLTRLKSSPPSSFSFNSSRVIVLIDKISYPTSIGFGAQRGSFNECRQEIYA